MNPSQKAIDNIEQNTIYKTISSIIGFFVIIMGLILPYVEPFKLSIFSRKISIVFFFVFGAILLTAFFLLFLDWININRGQTKFVKFGVGVFLFCILIMSIGTYKVFPYDTLLLYKLRPHVRAVLLGIGTLLISSSLSSNFGRRFWLTIHLVSRKIGIRRCIILIAVVVVFVSSFIGGYVLEGIPHHNDATTYLIQGRVLTAGKFALKPPKHPKLFHEMRLKFRVTSAGYVGRYPPGWPLILGIFDKLGARWLANPLLLAGIIIITSRLVGRHVGLLASVFLASCPFLLLNASDQLSHLATTFWLLLFLFGFETSIRDSSFKFAIISGLCLGCAILTRPADSLFFALPCIGLAIWWFVRYPRRYLRSFAAIAAGASVGAIFFLICNAQTTGSSTGTIYFGGKSIFEVILYEAPSSPLAAFRWLHENIVNFGTFGWYGVFPTAALIFYAFIILRREQRGIILLISCGTSVAVCYTVFTFSDDNPWFGPRWLTASFPAVAAMLGAVTSEALRLARGHHPSRVVYKRLLNWLAVGVIIVWIGIIPMKISEYLLSQPNKVDGRVVKSVRQAGLHNAVVALPLDTLNLPGFHKDPKAGFWSMQVPFKSNDVIFVTVSKDWQKMARESFPKRSLYYMNEIPGDYSLIPVTTLPE